MERKKKFHNIEIGSRLHDARENMGYTQAQFAEMLSISDEHYRRLESGASGISTEKMKVLHQKVNIDPTYLITGEIRHEFDIDIFMANSSREQRNQFLKRTLAYIEKIIEK